MSRCPPPLGPMSWAGRSSICRASSPTVSVLPRQERPHRQKRSIKRGAGLAGPGGHAGQHGTQSQSWHGEGDRRVWPEAAGVRVGASKRYSCGAAPLPTAAAISPGSRRGRQMCEGGASPGHWALSPLLLQVCLEWGWYTCLLPSQQSGPVTIFFAFRLLLQLFSFFLRPLSLVLPGMVLTPCGTSTSGYRAACVISHGFTPVCPDQLCELGLLSVLFPHYSSAQ